MMITLTAHPRFTAQHAGPSRASRSPERSFPVQENAGAPRFRKPPLLSTSSIARLFSGSGAVPAPDIAGLQAVRFYKTTYTSNPAHAPEPLPMMPSAHGRVHVSRPC